MKKLSSLFFVVFVMCCFSSLTRGAQLTVVADPWCPFTCNPQLGMNGAMIDVLAEIFGDVGKNVIYKNVDWASAVEQTRQGKYSAIAGALKSDAPDFVFPETPIGYQQSCVFSRKAKPLTQINEEAFKSRKWGAVKGYSYGEKIDALIAKYSSQVTFVEGVNTSQKLFELLREAKVDSVVEDDSVVAFLAALPSAPLKGVSFDRSSCLERQPLFVAFSPKRNDSVRMASLFDKGVARLKGTSKLSKIWKNYSIQE